MLVSGKDLVFLAILGIGMIVEAVCADALAPAALEAAQAVCALDACCGASAEIRTGA